MERYHILKLGLAITFYAAYCIRPMPVYSLEADNEVDNSPNPDFDYFQYFQGVDGRPGVDFPVYSYIPKTSFSCRGIGNGYYADLDTGCQVFHICEENRKISFLCPNGTIFQQSELICEWWNKVNCTNSPNLYEESAEKLQNDNARRKASRRVGTQINTQQNHGAIMRMEERSSVRATSNGKDFPVRKIPNNNDIEQQIHQAESNNMHLAKSNIEAKQKVRFNQHSNHNYNNGQQAQEKNPPPSRSKQTKKDIDKETGNYLNTNYEQSRRSKKVEQGQKNSYNFQEKANNFKEYHVQSSTTDVISQQTTKNGFQSTPPSTTKFVSASTAASIAPKKTPKPSYGTTIKEKYNSFDGRSPIKTSNSRGTVKYNTNYPTTYSPPVKYSTLTTTSRNSQQDNFDLPPFPKHKSELVTPRNSEGQIKVNIISQANADSGETQIPQESASFVKAPAFNSIVDNSFKTTLHPNHRSTYSDIKDLSYLQAPKVSSISSITPHLVTTQPINNGKPFVGSIVGNTVLPNQLTTQSKYTYLPTTTTMASSKPTIIFGVIRQSTTTESSPFGPPELANNLFNIGNTDKTLPPVEVSTQVTNSVPTELFNIGNTDTTLQANIVPNFTSTTFGPLKIIVPEEGSLNLGQTPVEEPPFIKKTVPLLYNNKNSSTEKTVDHATIYGTYSSNTPSSRNTPYSPTVPSVTQSTNNYGFSSTTRTPKLINEGVPIRFNKGQEKISIHLAKNVGGSTRNNGKNMQNYRTVGAVVRFGNVDTSTPGSNDFYITKTFAKSKTEKPRPFSKNFNFVGDNNNNNEKDAERQIDVSTPFPSYHISSARPFGISETTPTPFVTTPTSPAFNVYDNVDNMIGVLQEIANYNQQKEFSENSRPGLIVPPSVGPQTLHSLAQYFANELENNDTSNGVLEPETKEKLTSLLTAMTVHGYNHLFKASSTSAPLDTTYSTQGPETTTILTPARSGSEESSEGGSTTQADEDLLSTTSLPELRQLARNFSLALSSYLNDPDNFRKSLEGLRPTEPPPLDGNDNIESSTTEDELLNFSDADLKPSTPAPSSATWGYILASEANKFEEDIKNSLNPDLHTADSQSFVPRYNSVQVKEKQGFGTDLPPNHWTSSPKATELWKKALSINPAIVNDHFETTSISVLTEEQETTEPELFNTDVLADSVEPRSEINYELRELSPLALNSTQIHGILIDFMNHTKSDEHNRLNRILKKLNTSEEEFLNRMQEIESNPLTKRLILLLITECGANITKNLEITSDNILKSNNEPIAAAGTSSNVQVQNNAFKTLVHPKLSENDQDTRALQLLNSLYTIASRFGRK